MQNQNRVTDGEKIDIAMGGELPYSSWYTKPDRKKCEIFNVFFIGRIV